MTEIMIPVTGFFLSVPQASLPAPLPPGYLRREPESSAFAARRTFSTGFEPSGVKHAVTVAGACRVRIELTGVFGHNRDGAFVYLAMTRTDGNGSVKQLRNGGNVAAGRLSNTLDIAPFHADLMDDIPSAGTYEYEVHFCQSSEQADSEGWLGRRGQDIKPNIETVLTLTVLDP